MSFQNFQSQVSSKRTISEARRKDLRSLRQKLSNIGRKKDGLVREIGIQHQQGNARLQALQQAEFDARRSLDQFATDFAGALREEWAALTDFEPYTNPIHNVAFLQDDCPILLFPLRLETRFKRITRDGELVDQLWVRVFPDDIAVNSFESDLSDTEIRNARSYWLARWRAGREVDGNRAAWRPLAASHGPGRAYWLTKHYVPLNLAEEPQRSEAEIILVISTEEALARPELDSLVKYWEAVWKADRSRERLEQAWDELLAGMGEERANVLVRDYKPANLNEPPPAGLARDETAVRIEFVVFPKKDELEAKLHAWSQPPSVSILPERFVLLAFHDGIQDLLPQLGNLIPPKLILGPDPAAAQGEDYRLASKEEADADPNIHDGDLIFSENLRWMFDFEEAVTKGMGFKIDLSGDQARRGFDRVFVLGLKLSADRQKGQELLEELFSQHQSSRKGLGIIRQGTPTNNTEEGPSGYSWRHDPDDSFDIYFDQSDVRPDDTDWFHKTDGRWLAEFLGISAAKLITLENYFSMDISESKAMQRALWPATLGHFMDSMMNPVFGKNTIEMTRRFFSLFVSGRGNLPAIRVGRQPYGILPATRFSRMAWFRKLSGSNNFATLASTAVSGFSFLEKLYQILMDMDQTWSSLTSRVAFVGKTGDAHQILLDIVGLHPDSVEIYQRYANTLKQIHNVYNLQGFSHPDLSKYYLSSYLTAAELLAKYGYTINTENPEPDILKKSFFKDAWLLKGDKIDRVPNSEVTPIGTYTVDGKNYLQWLVGAAEKSHDQLRLQAGFVNDQPPTALLYLLLHHSLDLSYVDTSLKLHLSRGLFTQSQMKQAYIEPDFIQVEEGKETESLWKYLYKTNPRITGDANMTVGQYIPLHMDSLDEAAAFRDVLVGLKQLQAVPTARLDRLLMEHLDTVSYRCDAWILGFLHLQLAYMRGLGESRSDNPPRRGIYLGAYGWLEDVRPTNKSFAPADLNSDPELKEVFNFDGDLLEDPNNAGYILAPSLNHAVTAAVLRNGHLSNDDPEDKEDLKIKLSSQRVRAALQIVDGIRAGQTLSALLGYQFERGLHDRTDAEVDAIIFDLRNQFPLASKKFKDTTPSADEDPEYASIEQIEARNVIDGVAFLEHIEKAEQKTYPFGLELPEASVGQKAAINQVVQELIETNDAVADLALAESVHQVVLGNFERAAATLETYSKGNFPPIPEVIQTPRSGMVLTHRVALQFKTGLTHTLGAPGVTPRVVAEPAVQDWLSRIMPGLDKVVCVVRYVDRTSGDMAEREISLSDIGLAHIDALYVLTLDGAPAMSTLDDLVMQFVINNYAPRMDGGIQILYTNKLDSTKFTIFELTSLIASLRTLVLNSRPLSSTDVLLANEATRESQQAISLDVNRITPVIAALSDIRTTELADCLAALSAIMATDDVEDIAEDLDTLMRDLAAIFARISRFGVSQTGIGFIYQWYQSIYTQLRGKVQELIARWERHRTAYMALRAEYLDGVGSRTPEELLAILRKAELEISISSTASSHSTHTEYFDFIDGIQFSRFQDLLGTAMPAVLDLYGLSELIPAIQTLAGQISTFDIVGIDITQQLNQVRNFAGDLKSRAENLRQEMQDRESNALGFLGAAAETGDAQVKVELVKKAAKAIFGEDFVTVPEFSLDEARGMEWQNAILASEQSLRYLIDDRNIDFPMDDWLYGISRVREKLHALENAILQIEGLTTETLDLTPSQFPYREGDYWLGMQYPDRKDGSAEPFSIEEDKLLFTSIYTESFSPDRSQCGLLIDEWTEVIPSRDETLGLSFHYNQPNSEPPQTLLLVTPSDFRETWQWEDLVNTLHETLDLAKKRAVEPDHIDQTVYSHFLPPIVSLASPLPLTVTLNLALNNQVSFAKVNKNE